MSAKIFLGGVLVCICFAAQSTPLGRKGSAEIKMIDGAPAICLPRSAEENFPIDRFVISEIGDGQKPYWALYLEPRREAVTVKAGDCLMLASDLRGYRREGMLKLDGMKPEFSYVVMIDRVKNYKNPNTFYTAGYCVEKMKNGSIKYVDRSRAITDYKTAKCKVLSSEGVDE